jgi:hypothetical protein
MGRGSEGFETRRGGKREWEDVILAPVTGILNAIAKASFQRQVLPLPNHSKKTPNQGPGTKRDTIPSITQIRSP